MQMEVAKMSQLRDRGEWVERFLHVAFSQSCIIMVSEKLQGAHTHTHRRRVS